MKLALIKRPDQFWELSTEYDYEEASKFAIGEMIEVEAKKVRNPKFHRKFFALLNFIFENQSYFQNFEEMRKCLTMMAGFYTTFISLKGEVLYVPKSIAFANMDELEFADLYFKVIDIAIQHPKLLNGSTKEEIEEQVDAVLAFVGR